MITHKYQHSVKCNDGKRRNFYLFFIDDVMVLKLKSSYDNRYEKGYDGKFSVAELSYDDKYIFMTKIFRNKRTNVKYPYSHKNLNSRVNLNLMIIMKSDKEIFYKNRGVERNKKPLSNIEYRFEIFDEKDVDKITPNATEKAWNGKIIILYWRYQKKDYPLCFHGIVSEDEVRSILSPKQWGKFCNGKTEFIIQRRVDGKNVKKQ